MKLHQWPARKPGFFGDQWTYYACNARGYWFGDTPMEVISEVRDRTGAEVQMLCAIPKLPALKEGEKKGENWPEISMFMPDVKGAVILFSEWHDHEKYEEVMPTKPRHAASDVSQAIYAFNKLDEEGKHKTLHQLGYQAIRNTPVAFNKKLADEVKGNFDDRGNFD